MVDFCGSLEQESSRALMIGGACHFRRVRLSVKFVSSIGSGPVVDSVLRSPGAGVTDHLGSVSSPWVRALRAFPLRQDP